MSHEHDYFGEEEEIFYEDDRLFIRQRCTHREVYGSYTDDVRDEVYYDEGPRCTVQKTTVYDLDRIEQFGEDWETVFVNNGDWSEEDETLVLSVEEAVYDDIGIEGNRPKVDRHGKYTDVEPYGDEACIYTEVNGEEYRLVFEFTEEYEEGW